MNVSWTSQPGNGVTCYRHRDRETAVSCSSCGRPICPDCMNPSPVGMRCPECARDTTRVINPRVEAQLAEVAPVTLALIVANIAAFVAEIATGTAMLRVGGSASGTVLNDGFFSGPLVASGEWWRILSAGFLHLDLMHVGLNMALLFFLGRELEPAIGRFRFAALYGFGVVSGSLGSLLIEPMTGAAGASGAVFGLMGAAFIVARARGINPMESGIGGLILFNLVFTFAVPGISKGGHIGGLIGGAVVGYLLVELDERRHIFGRNPLPALLTTLALGGVLFYVTIAIAESKFAYLL